MTMYKNKELLKFMQMSFFAIIAFIAIGAATSANATNTVEVNEFPEEAFPFTIVWQGENGNVERICNGNGTYEISQEEAAAIGDVRGLDFGGTFLPPDTKGIAAIRFFKFTHRVEERADGTTIKVTTFCVICIE